MNWPSRYSSGFITDKWGRWKPLVVVEADRCGPASGEMRRGPRQQARRRPQTIADSGRCDRQRRVVAGRPGAVVPSGRQWRARNRAWREWVVTTRPAPVALQSEPAGHRVEPAGSLCRSATGAGLGGHQFTRAQTRLRAVHCGPGYGPSTWTATSAVGGEATRGEMVAPTPCLGLAIVILLACGPGRPPVPGFPLPRTVIGAVIAVAGKEPPVGTRASESSRRTVASALALTPSFSTLEGRCRWISGLRRRRRPSSRADGESLMIYYGKSPRITMAL